MIVGRGSAFILLLAVVFLAGCSQSGTTSVAGVAIEKFAPQMQTVPSNSPVEFTLLVKNFGEADAQDVKAVLGGLVFASDADNDETKLGKWKLSNDSLLKKSDPSKLLGEDAQSGFRGDEGEITWRLVSPTVSSNNAYEATANLIYSYSTVSTILIKAVDFNYLQSLPEDERDSVDTGVVVSKTTRGPLEISIKTDQSIVSGFSTLPIEIEFRNVGGGKIFTGGKTDEDAQSLYKTITSGMNKIKVRVPSGLTCSGSVENGMHEVKMVEGKSGRLFCTKEIGGISTTQTLSVDVRAEYRYLVEGKGVIKVAKTVYQPPIVDISVTGSAVDALKFDYGGSEMSATLGIRINNEGNQPVRGYIPVVYSFEADGKILAGDTLTEFCPMSHPEYSSDACKTDSIQPFESRIRLINVPLSLGTKKVSLSVFTDKYVEGKLSEQNDANNRVTSELDSDVDLSVDSLNAEVDDPASMRVRMSMTVTNNAKNVMVLNVPVGFDSKTGKYNVGKCDAAGSNIEFGKDKPTVLIKKLDKLQSQTVSCVYENPEKSTELEITGVLKIKDSDDTNNNNSMPNGGPNPFKISYDVSIQKGSSKYLPRMDGDIRYHEISTIVENRGTVTAKGLKVIFVEDGNECIVDNDICATPVAPLDISSEKTQKATCIPKMAFLESFKVVLKKDVKACVSGLPTESDKTNNKERFTMNWVDIVPPFVGQAQISKGTTSLINNENYYTGVISIQADAVEDQSTIKSCEYTLDGGKTWIKASYDNKRICFASDLNPNRDITINFRATSDGGTATGTAAVYKLIRMPTVTPSATSGGKTYTFDTWAKSGIQVTLTCTKDGTVDCKTIEYCTADDDTCAPSTSYSAPLTVSAEAVTYMRYQVTDTLGNVQAIKSLKLKVDAMPPDSSDIKVINIIGVGGPNYMVYGEASDRVIHLFAYERFSSGVPADSLQLYIKHNGKYWTGSTWSNDLTWVRANHTASNNGDKVTVGFDVPASSIKSTDNYWVYMINLQVLEPGTYAVKAKATDGAGNSAEGVETSFEIT